MHSLTPQLNGLLQLSAKTVNRSPEQADGAAENGAFSQEFAFFSALGLNVAEAVNQPAGAVAAAENLPNKTISANVGSIRSTQVPEPLAPLTGKDVPQRETIAGKILPPAGSPAIAVAIKPGQNSASEAVTKRVEVTPAPIVQAPKVQTGTSGVSSAEPLRNTARLADPIVGVPSTENLRPEKSRPNPQQVDSLLQQPKLAQGPVERVAPANVQQAGHQNGAPTALNDGRTVESLSVQTILDIPESKTLAATDTRQAGLTTSTNLQLIEQQSAARITSRSVRGDIISASELAERPAGSVPSLDVASATNTKSPVEIRHSAQRAGVRIETQPAGQAFSVPSEPLAIRTPSELTARRYVPQGSGNLAVKPAVATTTQPVSAKVLSADDFTQSSSSEQAVTASDDSLSNASPMTANAATSVSSRNSTGQATPNLQFGDPSFQRQLNDHLLVMAGQGVHKAQISLNPQELGPLDIRLAVNNDEVSVQLASANALVREALEQAMPRLKELFEHAGLKLVEQQVAHHFNEQGTNRNTPQAPSRHATALTSEMAEMPHTPGQAARALPDALVDTYI